jgi:hypothetical protein
MIRTTTSFLVTAGAGKIGQDSPHELRRHGKKMRSILPVHLSTVNQA